MVRPTKLVPVPEYVSIHWRVLHQDLGETWRQISLRKDYKKYNKSTICRHMKLELSEKADKRRGNKSAGRPTKLTAHDRRLILRQINILRDRGEVNFGIKRIKTMANMDGRVCDETIRLVLKGDDLKYRNAARKGELIRKDLKDRYEFAKRVKEKFKEVGPGKFFMDGIAFYLDGVAFTHKCNPHDQALAVKRKVWRRKGERLKFGLTAKSNNIGVGGKLAHFLVAIAHKKGVILCEEYKGHMTGAKFAEFVTKSLPDVFRRSANPRGRYFVQDGDKSQNSACAREALKKIGAHVFSIPPRSPDLNPIENMFNLVRRYLPEEALAKRITHENWDQFVERVKQQFARFDSEILDRTIESMPKRLDLVIKSKGERTRY